MRNFVKIAANIDFVPILAALGRNKELWDQNTLRTQHPGTAHSEVSDIWVWFNDVSTEALERVVDDRDVVPYPAWFALPIRNLVFDLMRRVEAVRVGRVIITCLPPGKRITPHVDQGAPATYYSRFHICLQNNPGSMFRIGNEPLQMNPGEVWQIDNKIEHEVINNSNDDRIVIIVDLRCE